MPRLAAALLLAGTAAAQSQAPPPDAGRLLQQTQPAAPALPPTPSPPRIVEPPVRPTVELPEGVTIEVSAFRISGARSFPESVLAPLVQPWVGRRLDLRGLNEAAGAITRHYQGAGHLLTYAYLPAQRIEGGVVEIAVLEGRIDAVQVVTAQDVRLRDEVVQAHVEPLAGQVPLLQADVERRLLLLNDIPGVTARAAFTPGAASGSADVVVSVAEEEPLALRAELDNHGSRSTGEVRVGLGLRLADAFGRGDLIGARALVTQRGRLLSGHLEGQLPLGGDGWRVGAHLSRLNYQLAGAFAALGASGSANVVGVHARYPLVRRMDFNLSARAGFEHKRLADDIELTASRNPRRNDVFELAFSADGRDRWGATAASLTAYAGDLTFHDDLRRQQDAAGLLTGRAWRKLGAQFVRQQSLHGPLSLLLRVAGQASGGNLDSSEKLSLSGPGAVRAYAPGEAAVDQGALASAELRYSLDYQGGNVVGALFVDHGRGLVNRRPLVAAGNDARLSGAGLGLQWTGGEMGLAASLAWRGDRLPLAEGGDPRPRLYLQFWVAP
ncbi:MAG: ShlB/FhaC/HecB family hemolysin secretion/activation protein [Rubrivivax sp.]|nr:ShlB/FhaC/HecB family hemolysin secretion/activation protein [Rubrivivax sp.]